MGKYLGSMDTKGQNKRHKFQFLIEKVQRRLSGWKAQNLSLAGRLTLAQSVTSQIPIFHMMHSKIPVSVCMEIDRLQRNFIWGTTETRRSYHAVNWQLICTPKEMGGYGLKDLKHMNDALLCKTAWSIISEPQKLSTRIIKGKYGRGNDLLHHATAKAGDSIFWKCLCRLWPTFVSQVGKDVVNGEDLERASKT